MILSFKGKSQNASAWAKEYGIPAATIISRIGRGWTPEQALTTEVFSNDNKITKNDAELWLNDRKLEELPRALKNIVIENATPNLKRYGAYIRRYHPKSFDQWYDNVYLKEKQNEKRTNSGR